MHLFSWGKKIQTGKQWRQYLRKSVSYLFMDKNLLLSFYLCKCPSVNYLGQNLGQRFSSFIYSARKRFIFLWYSTLAITYASESRDRTLALLTVHSSFLDIEKQMFFGVFIFNRGVFNVLIQQGIMKFKKAKCKVLHLDGAIPITNKGWMGNGLRPALRRTAGNWWMKNWTWPDNECPEGQ